MTARNGSAVARQIASRLAEVTRSDGSLRWTSCGLGGNSGIALLFAALAKRWTDEGWAEACYDHLSLAAQDERQGASLFSGLAGLGFAAQYADSVVQGATDGLLQTISEYLGKRVENDLATFKKPEQSTIFDLIFGYAGIRVALTASSDPVGARIDDYFRWLCEPGQERWSAKMYGSEQLGEGWYNVGPAHGILGPIGLLAYADPRPLDEIAETVEFLVRLGRDGFWPAGVRGPETIPGRQAWCYGGPGVSAAIAAYARRVHDDHMAAEICDHLVKLARHEPRAWGVVDFGICHGLAGVALAYQSAALTCEDDRLLAISQRLTTTIIEAFNPEITWGYQAKLADGTDLDDPTFLTGATGIALALLTLDDAADRKWLPSLALS